MYLELEHDVKHSPSSAKVNAYSSTSALSIQFYDMMHSHSNNFAIFYILSYFSQNFESTEWLH